MLHSKLMAIRVGSTTAMANAAVAVNRFQFIIGNSANGSIVAATRYSPCRNQHILCAKTTTVQPSRIHIENAQYHRILGKKTTSFVSVSTHCDSFYANQTIFKSENRDSFSCTFYFILLAQNSMRSVISMKNVRNK